MDEALHGEALPDGCEPGRFQSMLADGRIQCDLCPRRCRLHDGQRAFCFVRQRMGDRIILTSYGKATGFCIDPIEKKPLNHFYPGTSVLSFGTAGCNLGCKFCQNWDISKAREIERLSDSAQPEQIAQAAVEAGCDSVAFTYNDPIIFAEYAIDTAKACRSAGIHSVAVTNGYITKEARGPFFSTMDAANVDLKAFTDSFYKKICFADLQPILDTLVYVKKETSVWLEVTTLLIPGHNDSVEEVNRLCAWFIDALGPDVPLHFTAFHPDYKMTDIPPTPPETCARAREQALKHGLHYVYSGNIRDRAGQSTYCASCGTRVIERDGYWILSTALENNRCGHCGATLPGAFSASGLGKWGGKRRRVQIMRP